MRDSLIQTSLGSAVYIKEFDLSIESELWREYDFDITSLLQIFIQKVIFEQLLSVGSCSGHWNWPQGTQNPLGI